MTQRVAGPHLPSLFRSATVGLLLALAGLGWSTAHAATYYWDTSSGLWTTGANWSDSPISGGTTGTVPANDTASDTAVFNQAAVNGDQQVQLSQNQSIAGVTFGNTGSTTLVSNAATVRTLSLGSGGLMVRAGAGSVTIGSSATPVNVAIDGSQTFTNESSNVLTLTGTVSRLAAASGTQSLTVAGSGATGIAGRLVNGGASGVLNLTKSGVGTLTFNGTASSSFGSSTLRGGTILVDFTNHTTGTNLYSTGDVFLAGGRMLLKGRAAGSTAQTLGTVTANPGGGSILADANGGSMTVTLGSLSLNTGGTLLIGQSANSTGTVTFTRTTAPGSSGAAYSQSLVFTNGSAYDWATSTSGAAPYVISAFTGYVSLATTAGTDTSQSRITGDTTLAGARTTNSLKIENPAVGQSLALGANTLTLTGGAMLVTGSNAFTITSSGGIISNNTSVIIHQYNTGGLTIAPRFGGGFTTGFTKAGPGLLTLTSTNNQFAAPIFVNSGTLAIGGAGRLIGTTGTYAGNVTIATEGVFEFASSAASILSGTISGAGSFRQSGSGTTTLLGANTYAGQTRISAGVLAVGGASAISSQSSVLVDGGGFNLAGFNNTVGTVTITSGSIYGSGTLSATAYGLSGGTVTANLGGGTLNVTGNSALNGTTGAGTVNLNAGALTLGSGGRFTSSSVAITGSAGASLSLGGNEVVGSLAGAANIALGAHTLSVGSANANTIYSGNLSGSGGLTKLGSGVLTLSGSSNYSGATAVSGGVLAVNGRIASSVNVAGGATLGGSGEIAGDIGGDGLIAPGNSPGILTVSGQLNATGSTAFAFEFSAPGAPVWSDAANSVNDVLRLTGTSPFTAPLTASNVINVYFDVTSLSQNDTFLGGFFVDNPNGTANLLASGLGTAAFQYFVKGDGQGGYSYNNTNYYSFDQYKAAHPGITGLTQSVASVASANFSAGTITTGQVMQFVVVPEPDTVVCAGIGIIMAGWSLSKRRHP